MKKGILFCAAFIFLSNVAVAQKPASSSIGIAQQPASPTKTFYLEVYGGMGIRTNQLLSDLKYAVDILAHTPEQSDVNDVIKNQHLTWALGGGIGYQFNQLLAAEFGAFYIGETEYKAKRGSFWINASGTPSTLGFDNWLYYLVTKAILWHSDRFNVFSKFGLGLNHLSFFGSKFFSYVHGVNTAFAPWQFTSVNGIGPVFGLGSTYFFNHKLFIDLEYMRFGTSWNTFIAHSITVVSEHKLGTRWRKRTGPIDLILFSIGYNFN